jgi:hypothetical protein
VQGTRVGRRWQGRREGGDVAEPVLVFVLAVAMAVVVVVVVVVPVMVPVVVLAGSCGGLAVMLPGRGRVWGRGVTWLPAAVRVEYLPTCQSV